MTDQKFTIALTEAQLNDLRRSLMYALAHLDKKQREYATSQFSGLRQRYETDRAAVEDLLTVFLGQEADAA